MRINKVVVWLCTLTCVMQMMTVSLTLPRPRPRALYDLRKMWSMSDLARVEASLFPSQLAESRNATYLFRLSTNAPTNSRRVQLWSKTRNFLQIFKNGVINGTEKYDNYNKYSFLTMETMSPSIVRIRGDEANMYVAMDKQGRLFATDRARGNLECLFKHHHEENNWESFSSYPYGAMKNRETGWLLSIRRNGKIKRPKRTVVGEKSTQFLVLNLF